MSPAPDFVIATAPAGNDVRGAVMLLLACALLAIVFVCASAAVIALRRGRRMRDAASVRTRTEHVDAWAEAGRRAPTPGRGAIDESDGG